MKNAMNKKILRLAVPSIISNITVPLLGLVDVAITGHMGKGIYMAAIAVGSMVFNIIYWLFAFLRFGTGGLTAQAYGESSLSTLFHNEKAHPSLDKTLLDKDLRGVRLLLMKSQMTCLLMALLLIVFQVPLFHLVIWIIAPAEDLIPIIRTYYNICIWGTLPSLSLYAFTGWFVGMQNTKLPMIISMTQNVVNICLSCFFVYLLHWKIDGVATGTLMAQWSGMLMAICMLCINYKQVVRGIQFKWSEMTEGLDRFFSVNRIIFLRTVFLVAVNLYFIVIGAKGGAVILAVNSVLMQMFILYTYVMDGFAFAAEALCGRYYGAQDSHNFHLALKGVWLWGTALTIVYTLAYAFGGDFFISMLTDNRNILLASQKYMPWAIAIPFCGLAAFVWDGVFVGITNLMGMLWATMFGAIAFFAIYYFLYPMLHNHALWLAFNACLLMRGIVQQVVYMCRL